ncbi:plasmid partitioning protein RepB [Rhodovulum sp. DZ06]|uniref:plasmid partitioning protein RepB n=1 Tax=Rhodovulum sp. DZ06 TaxID=3425126 RepID=UPI003D3304AE
MSRKTRKSMLADLMAGGTQTEGADAARTAGATAGGKAKAGAGGKAQPRTEEIDAAPGATAKPRAAGREARESAAPAAPARRPAARKGAVGAISSAVAAMRANAVVELDPNAIHAGGLSDRLEDVQADDAELRRSIRAHGQQVPVLVRPHPGTPGEWQIVYGRRRVLAARDLGIKVKALVRELDDEALVMAQGQENAARRDLSFIEKVNFARQMEEAGYDRAAIGDALAADKTLVSRMLAVAAKVPAPVIGAIGAAHGVGRPRWLELAALIEGRDPEDVAALVPAVAGDDPAGRFDALLAHLKRKAAAAKPAAPRPEALEIRAEDGAPLAVARRAGQGGRLSLALEAGAGFEDWLLAELPALHAKWKAGQGS